MKETIEHNNRFYGEELKTESEQLKEWLMIANKENEKLHSIIKEVREYITNEDNQTKRGIYPNYWYEVKVKEILLILD